MKSSKAIGGDVDVINAVFAQLTRLHCRVKDVMPTGTYMY